MLPALGAGRRPDVVCGGLEPSRADGPVCDPPRPTFPRRDSSRCCVCRAVPQLGGRVGHRPGPWHYQYVCLPVLQACGRAPPECCGRTKTSQHLPAIRPCGRLAGWRSHLWSWLPHCAGPSVKWLGLAVAFLLSKERILIIAVPTFGN